MGRKMNSGTVHRVRPNAAFPEGSWKISCQEVERGVRSFGRAPGTPGSVKCFHDAVTWDSQVLWLWSGPVPCTVGKVQMELNQNNGARRCFQNYIFILETHLLKFPGSPQEFDGFHHPKQSTYIKPVISSPRKINQCLPAAPTSSICHVCSSPSEATGKHI